MKSQRTTRRRMSTSIRWNLGRAHFLLAGLLLLWNNSQWLNGATCSSLDSGLSAYISSGLPVACAALDRRKARLRSTNTEGDAVGVSNGTADFKQAESKRQPKTFGQILAKAGHKAVGGGIPGMVAGVVQVLSLMWLRTIINYQCRYGTTFREAWVTLYKDGGISRFYQGMGFALFQTPLSRFGSTAANDGVETFMAAFTNWGPGRTTVVASVVVGLWRIAIMPLDTFKTVLQVDSAQGFHTLWRKVKAGNFGVLYQGAAAMALAAMAGHYPWFYTYNVLSQSSIIQRAVSSSLLRNAFIGVIASIVSDTIVNSIRVVKTMKQTMGSKHHGGMGYTETIRIILAADGWKGLFGRGLQTRIFANGLQSLVFTVIWRGLADHWRRKAENGNA
ncbi:Mitochondrial carrier protein [Seminavis robusta]|uniref:Mitochondrial carrier protein n=1 Tax=Seminavis robusta TaxID=568900 RepID=A0A9N8ESJ7_9STRA|nr:Mitochondrial carrier protein [Seminavis robusta]|eukprot:Sro1474_g275740.1 Mitochondrial carrier protein (390) ;mRNA; f:15909-17393